MSTAGRLRTLAGHRISPTASLRERARFQVVLRAVVSGTRCAIYSIGSVRLWMDTHRWHLAKRSKMTSSGPSWVVFLKKPSATDRSCASSAPQPRLWLASRCRMGPTRSRPHGCDPHPPSSHRVGDRGGSPSIPRSVCGRSLRSLPASLLARGISLRRKCYIWLTLVGWRHPPRSRRRPTFALDVSNPAVQHGSDPGEGNCRCCQHRTASIDGYVVEGDNDEGR